MTTTTTALAAHPGQILEAAGFPATKSTWGNWRSPLDNGVTVQLTEDDGTHYLTVFTGGPAMLVHTEATFAGPLARTMLDGALSGLRAA